MASQRDYYPLDPNRQQQQHDYQQQQWSSQQHGYQDQYQDPAYAPSSPYHQPSSPYHDNYGGGGGDGFGGGGDGFGGGPSQYTQHHQQQQHYDQYAQQQQHYGGGSYGAHEASDYGTPRGAGSSGAYHDPQQQSSGGYFPDQTSHHQQQHGYGGDVGLMNDYGEPHMGASAANAYLGDSGGTAQYSYSPAASQVNLTSGDGDGGWESGRPSNAGSGIGLRQYSDGAWASPGASKLASSSSQGVGYSDSKDPWDDRAAGLAKYGVAKNTSGHKKAWMLFGIAVVVLCLAGGAVAVVYELVIKKKHPGPGQAIAADGKIVETSGADGSVVDLGNGTTFIYNNTHGGFWVSDPLNNSAQAQSYTPPLSEEFDFVKNRILGVNIGSWLVTEPFLAPALYEPYENDTNGVPYTGDQITGDEYALCTKWIEEGGGGAAGKQYAYNKIKEHYDTYITEQDFAEIAGAGLNWIRLPIGFWAVETYSDEPFVEGLAWQYFLKAIQWARKYGLRINLDLHAVPGSQNGYNHSGKLGSINFLHGPMGYANAQRTLNIIRTITEFISQPTIRPVVPMFSILNEPLSYNPPTGIGMDVLQNYMGEIYGMMRNISGYGKGNGPIITMHDGFQGFGPWNTFMRNADRIFYDDHPYVCFNGNYKDWDATLPQPCNYFADQFDQSLATNGISMAGEWSVALADCSLWLNNVGQGARYDGTYLQADGTPDPQFPKVGECGPWDDWWTYNSSMKANINKFALVQMDAYKNWFFWNWKTGVTGRTGRVANPLWSYQLGIQQGWMPKNPNSDPKGACKSVANALGATISPTNSWQTTFAAWQTGGAGSYPATPPAPWPPATISAGGAVGDLPSYTPTGPIQTMSGPTPTITLESSAPPDFGSGWFDATDTAGWFAPIAGCNYPTDAYTLSNFDFGSNWPCGAGGAAGKRSPSVAPGAVETPKPEERMTREEIRRAAPAPTPAPPRG